ncbi:hypothetical protein [Algoriphagus sp. A40]|uniref:hypothetical protein n=1 Tax=Algoriphagus sp. A40 TaxID=1945863 RepID=UPI00098586F6|nr:hypothetical protein [Algoriphagus sp. A40]OOG69577.1 hypothetical protein B0E43_21560 [Algoriphagus sp. A40]
MKIKLSILFFLGIMTQAFSQEGFSIHLRGVEGCYIDYYTAFANKGASDVTDGEHEVVISVLYQNMSECYIGKVTVKDGKFVAPVMIQKDDMSYATLATIFKDFNQEWYAKQDPNTLYEINGGMSKMFLSQQGYQVQMFFPGFINKNSGVNRKAPPANELLKDNN